jgi:hypothetical protein
MRPTFDIFTVSPDGEPVWIESVETLENAREDLMETARIAPRRDCFVYSDESGIVEVVLRADFQGLRRTYSLTGEHDGSRSYRSSSADPYVVQAATDQMPVR